MTQFLQQLKIYEVSTEQNDGMAATMSKAKIQHVHRTTGYPMGRENSKISSNIKRLLVSPL